MNKEAILSKLRSILEKSYSPYSEIRVSSAVKYQLNGKEEIEFGTNIENFSYGLANCAERTAVFSAVTNGMTSIEKVYVMSNLVDPIKPCGACLQVLSEFIDNSSKVNVICLNEAGVEEVFSFDELLPYSFKKGE